MAAKCEHCGTKIKGRAAYCSGCGEPVGGAPVGGSRGRRGFYIVGVAVIVLIAAIGGFAAAGGFDQESTVTASGTPAESPSAESPSAESPSEAEAKCSSAADQPNIVVLREAVEDCYDLSTAAARCVMNSLRADGLTVAERASAVAERAPGAERAAADCSKQHPDDHVAGPNNAEDECYDDASCAAAEADWDPVQTARDLADQACGLWYMNTTDSLETAALMMNEAASMNPTWIDSAEVFAYDAGLGYRASHPKLSLAMNACYRFGYDPYNR